MHDYIINCNTGAEKIALAVEQVIQMPSVGRVAIWVNGDPPAGVALSLVVKGDEKPQLKGDSECAGRLILMEYGSFQNSIVNDICAEFKVSPERPAEHGSFLEELERQSEGPKPNPRRLTWIVNEIDATGSRALASVCVRGWKRNRSLN